MKRALGIIAITLAIGLVACSENAITETDVTVEDHAVAAKSDNLPSALPKKYWVSINFDYCAVWDSNGDMYIDEHATAVSASVPRSGGEMFTCTIKGVPNDTGRNLRYDADNLPEGVYVEDDPGSYMAWGVTGLTSKWSAIVTPSGTGIIKAWINPSTDEFMSYGEYFDYMSTQYCPNPDHAGEPICGCVLSENPDNVGSCWGF